MRVGRHDSFHDEVCYKASELDQAHHSFSGRDETCPHASQRWWTSGGSPDCPTIRVRGLPHLEQTASARVTRKTCSHASHRCQTEPAPTLRVWSLPHFGHMCAMDSPTNTARVVPLLTGRIRCWQFAAHFGVVCFAPPTDKNDSAWVGPCRPPHSVYGTNRRGRRSVGVVFFLTSIRSTD